MMRNFLLRILLGIGIGAVVYVLIAVSLVFSQWPGKISQQKGLHFDKLERTNANTHPPLITYKTRDGSELQYRYYKSEKEDVPLVVLIHGSGWHGGAYLVLASSLSLEADVVVPDLRGHGVSPMRRGDVDYIGQLEDDLVDLVRQKRQKGQKIILAGHSSGGGLVIRFAGGPYGKMLDSAVLIAPYLRYDAPTIRPQSGGWAHPLTRRIIGLTMLNAIGVRVFNHLVAVQFNFPEIVLKGRMGHTATSSYSYRLQNSYAPRSDYLKDVGGLPRFILIAGKNDEAFLASRYEETLSRATTKGTYHILDGLSHFDVVNSADTQNIIREFLQTF